VTADDGAWMRRALDLARSGWGQTAPNPMVGAVLVRGGVIVGEGYHSRYGGDHAEVVALRAAGERAAGSTAYVTLEPCSHTGQTPPCVDALIDAGVRRVVMSMRDPNPIAAGGLERLAGAGVETAVGLENVAARELNAPFVYAQHSDRPWVTLKLATSIDGAVADAARTAGFLTGEAARAEVHHLRAGSDGIAIGIETALIDDPQLTVRLVPTPRVPPTRIVFDRTARLPLDGRLVRTALETPLIVVAARPHPVQVTRLESAGVVVLKAPTLEEALRALRERGIRSLLVEGGPRLAGAFYTASAVDRLIIFQAPVVLGAGALPAFGNAPPTTVAAAKRLPVVDRRALGSDVMTVYALSDP
jgi:diaminohydroxyphosphoribosylaminopyrimidine deaminase / 5-amino-6-(5-phosphoribosylamino)uracil reductase